MDTFFTALIGGCFGVLLVSAFLPSGKLRRRPKEALMFAFAAVVGAGISGLAVGEFADGLAAGVAMGIAFVLMPLVVLRIRQANGEVGSGGR